MHRTEMAKFSLRLFLHLTISTQHEPYKKYEVKTKIKKKITSQHNNSVQKKKRKTEKRKIKRKKRKQRYPPKHSAIPAVLFYISTSKLAQYSSLDPDPKSYTKTLHYR